MEWRLFLCLLASAAGAVSAQVSVNGSLGGSVDFILHITLPANRAITWRTGEGSIYIARILNNDPPTYNTSYTSRTLLFPNGTLRLDKLTDADKRIYGVTVENQADFTNQVVDYQLGVFPPLSAPVLRSSVTANNPFVNGTNMSLQCDAGNQTVISYIFQRDGQKIICSERLICSGSFLNFTPVADNDGGTYTCTIQNPVSSNTSNSLSLSVYFPVSNVTVTSNVSGLVWPGLDSVTLKCSARGTNVSYSWSLQGAPISGGGRYTLTDNNSTLIISAVSTNDNGSFVCTAKNLENSQTSSDVKFILASPVSAVTLTSNTSAVLWAEEDSASLHCSALGSAITFSWSLNGSQVSSNPPYYITQSDSPPNSNLTISPVSKIDTGPVTCKATNRANNETSSAINLNVKWSPDGNIVCTAQPIGQLVQLGCSWPGGNPAANVTMTFGNVQNTSINQVFRNVSSSSNIHGSSLTCNGYQRRNSSCVVPFEPPSSPDHKNETVNAAEVGGAVNLTVNLLAGVKSRATAVSAQVLPATFSWYQGNSSTTIPVGGKFRVDSTPYASTLNIDKLTEAESGNYKCVAENFIGNTTFLFNVKVSQRDAGSSGGLDGGAIAGIVIGVLAGVAIIGIIVFFIVKKKKRSGEDGRVKELDNQIGTIEYAKIQKNNKPNGAMAETEITNPPQEEKDEVKYVSLQLPNNSSTKAPAPEKKEETIYSDVKTSTKR
ncbi:cell adhesion molecule CEACAM1-like [Phyllobates terribilis]|uniref:cell adhesion molecule CEACAM1-like n=1 Tax=Phyllobates terribilis TaxID=111132 RepID=UPI003CCAC7E8